MLLTEGVFHFVSGTLGELHWVNNASSAFDCDTSNLLAQSRRAPRSGWYVKVSRGGVDGFERHQIRFFFRWSLISVLEQARVGVE